MVRTLMQRDRDKRPSAAKALSHPWLRCNLLDPCLSRGCDDPSDEEGSSVGGETPPEDDQPEHDDSDD